MSIAFTRGHLDVAHRLLDWEQTRVREGIKLACAHVSFYMHLPDDISGLIVEFTSGMQTGPVEPIFNVGLPVSISID